MKEITLANGAVTIVDDDIYFWASELKWKSSNNGYAMCHPQMRENGKTVYRSFYLHRLVNRTPEGFDTDHINGNRLDNRRENLRTLTRSQNITHAKVCVDNRSGFDGVNFQASRKSRPWRARVTVGGKIVELGGYADAEDAYMVRLAAKDVIFSRLGVDLAPVQLLRELAANLLREADQLMDFGNVQPSVWEQGPIGEPDKDAA
jgi:HNH endonuclease